MYFRKFTAETVWEAQKKKKKKSKAVGGVRVGVLSYRCGTMTIWIMKMRTAKRMGNPRIILHVETTNMLN